MAARGRPALFWLPRARLHLACARRPTTLYRRRRFQETCSAPGHKLLICLADEGEYESRCDSQVSSNGEGALRRMKKILMTLFQVSVTIAVLYWVYHDPNRRTQMGEAIRNA